MLFKIFGKKDNKKSQSSGENESPVNNEPNIALIVETAVRNELASFIAQTQKENKNTGLRLQELITLESETADMISENTELTKEIADTIKTEVRELNEKNDAMRKAIIQTADMIEDFYLFAKKGDNPDIFGQAELMWANACKTLNGIGLTGISNEKAMYDPLLNEIKGTVCDESYANGVVTEVFRSGYIYNCTVLRKSEVIVNKL